MASPESYTPRHLAEKILTSRQALEGERKQVTVLFADIKGSMELLARRDPEEARHILDPVLAAMMEAVHHYEGTVNQVMGDGIMALFGAPLAHEDHAVRACYAALRMQERVRRLTPGAPPIEIRVGLNSGDVVVRAIGNDLQMDYSAIGETTHLAARMEQMAEADSILATSDTVRLVEGYVQATSLGKRTVKGRETPVEVFAIRGAGPVRWPLEAAAARGLSDFVGRQGELAQLLAALESAADGRGQVVGVVGEPGVGKSRLFHELTRSDRMAGWLVLKTGAASYGKATAYRPVIDLLRRYFEIDDRDDQSAVRHKIATRVAALGDELVPALPALLSVLDLPIDDPAWHALEPRQRRHQTMDTVRQLFLHESRRQPLCLVLEDLHWIDSETQALLDRLVESVPAARILLLVNYRPEYRHDWGSKTYYAQVRVDALSRGSAGQLLRSLLGDAPEVDGVKDLLIERTGGNPFFLEETVRALVENAAVVGRPGAYRLAKPIETILVPPTVQAVLAARIDRLEPHDKRLLQCAAVIGEHVPIALLHAVADLSEPDLREGVARLCAAEFLYDIQLSTEPEYVFRHGLTRQVAYDSLLRARRRSLHARIVDALEHLHAGRLGEHVAQLAHHARGGELWDRALTYLRQAGTKAFEHSANREAVTWFEQALEVLARIPDAPERQAAAVELHLALRNAFTLLGEHEITLRHLHEAQRLAERLGDRRRLGRALSFEVNSLLLLGQHAPAIECARRARAVADELGDVRLRTVTDLYAGRAHLQVGDFSRAIATFEEIVDALTGPLERDHLGIPVLPSVFARSLLAECLAAVGRFADSARYAGEAVALAETANHPDTTLWAHHGAGVHHLARGEVAAATEAFERAYAVCRAHDMPAYRPRISAELGVAWALGGRVRDALPMAMQAAHDAAARRQTTSYSQVLLLLAEIELLADRLDEAARDATTALEHFRRQEEAGHEARALRLLGDVAAARSTADAEAWYEAARTAAERLGMRPLLAYCELGLARVLARAGRDDRARAMFQAASARFGELGMTDALVRTEAERSAIR